MNRKIVSWEFLMTISYQKYTTINLKKKQVSVILQRDRVIYNLFLFNFKDVSCLNIISVSGNTWTRRDGILYYKYDIECHRV